MLTDVEDRSAPPALFELGLERWGVPLVGDFFRGGEIGIGSGRGVEAEFIAVTDLPPKDELGDPFNITE